MLTLTDMLLIFITFVLSMVLFCIIKLGMLMHKHFHYLGDKLEILIKPYLPPTTSDA